MKTITLIRHARVDIDAKEKINAKELKNWVEQYNSAPIAADSKPSEGCILRAQKADVVATSALRRAIDSAHTLGLKIDFKSSLFNEADIPEINAPWLKLKAKTWLVVLRLMLFMRLGKKEVSLSESKKQAILAAKYLVELSDKYDNIVVVGHGGMNWLITKALIKEGWSQKGKASYKNWGESSLEAPLSLF